MIELVVVIVVIALLLGLAAFGYTKFVAGSRETAARSVAVQVAKAIQGHSANHQLPYGEPVYGDGTDGTVLGSHPAPDVVAGDLSDGAAVSGMIDDIDLDSGEQVSTITVTRDGYDFPVVFATGQVGTPGHVPGTGTPAAPGGPGGEDDGGLVAPTDVRVDQPLGTQAVLTWTGSAAATGYTISADGTDVWTGTGTTATLDGLPPGDYTVTVTATNSTETASSTPVSFTIHGFNDNRAAAWPITQMGPEQQWTTGDATNATATLEAGEPGLNNAAASVWWTFTAPADGTYTFETLAPSGGTTLGGHTLHVFEKDTATVRAVRAASSLPNATAAHLTAGETIEVRIYSIVGATRRDGAFRLRVSRGPANDDRAHAVSLPVPAAGQQVVTENATNVRSGIEPGEPAISNADASVWWSFTAPADGTYTFETLAPSGGATTLGGHTLYVFEEGTATVRAVRAVSAIPSVTSVHLAAGETVDLKVHSIAGAPRRDGAFRLRVSRGPTNDDRAHALALPAPAAGEQVETGTLTNVHAGHEPDEPLTGNAASSVWWSFTAPDDGTYTFQTITPGDADPLGAHTITIFDQGGSTARVVRSGTSLPVSASDHLTAGQTVHVRIQSIIGSYRRDGAFRIRVSR